MISKSGNLHAHPRVCTRPRFRCHRTVFDASSKVHLRSPLSPMPAAVKPRLLTTTFSTTAFDRSTLWRFEAPPARRLRRTYLHLTCSMALSRLRGTTHTRADRLIGVSLRCRALAFGMMEFAPTLRTNCSTNQRTGGRRTEQAAI